MAKVTAARQEPAATGGAGGVHGAPVLGGDALTWVRFFAALRMAMYGNSNGSSTS